MRNVSTALTVLGAAACWYFAIAYWAFTRGGWRHTPAGRHVMGLSAALGALLTLIAVARLWPDFPGRAWVTLGLFAVLVAQLVWQCVLLHRAQRPGR